MANAEATQQSNSWVGVLAWCFIALLVKLILLYFPILVNRGNAFTTIGSTVRDVCWGSLALFVWATARDQVPPWLAKIREASALIMFYFFFTFIVALALSVVLDSTFSDDLVKFLFATVCFTIAAVLNWIIPISVICFSKW